MNKNSKEPDARRRKFIKDSSLLAGTLAVTPLSISAAAHVASSDEIKFALIGCGGRGTGAAAQILTTDPSTRLVAMVEPFKSRLDDSYKNLVEKFGKDRVDVPPELKHATFKSVAAAIGYSRERGDQIVLQIVLTSAWWRIE